MNAQGKNGTGVAGLDLEMLPFLLPVKGSSWNIPVHSEPGREGCLGGSDPQGTFVISGDILWLSQQELGDAMASSGRRPGMQ